MTNKMNYYATPEVEVVETSVENGFLLSAFENENTLENPQVKAEMDW